MKLEKMINNIINELDFNELEIREENAECDFKGTFAAYRDVVKDLIKEKSEFFNEQEFAITDENINKIINEVQEKINNDYSCNNVIIFETENELANYLDVDDSYVNSECSNFLGCERNTIFNSKNDIIWNDFKTNGFIINKTEVNIASVQNEYERYKEYYCIEMK